VLGVLEKVLDDVFPDLAASLRWKSALSWKGYDMTYADYGDLADVVVEAGRLVFSILLSHGERPEQAKYETMEVVLMKIQ
jgi:hypothetical protein